MASWMIHLRVAEKLYEKIQEEVLYADFIVGNIGPDSGLYVGNDEQGRMVFRPNADVTHFTKGRSGKEFCDYKGFWQQYGFERVEGDLRQWSFLVGYAVHLMCDCLWSKLVNNVTKEKYHTLYETDPAQYYRLVKADWYDLDDWFLAEHKDFAPFVLLESIHNYPDYLPFYKENNLSTQIRYIVDFYRNYERDCGKEYVYLTRESADAFVLCAVEEIYHELFAGANQNMTGNNGQKRKGLLYENSVK